MESTSDTGSRPSTAKRIIARFMALLTAQGVEGVVSTAFFLYLAWLNKTVYGEVMLALAGAAVVSKVVQFGLYYPLVGDLGAAEKDEAPGIINRVNIIKLVLLLPALAGALCVAWYSGYSFRLSLILLFMCVGGGLEAVADTFFADLRVRGRQKLEARIRIAGSVLSYGYGVVTAFLGLNPVIVGMFKIISGTVWLSFGAAGYLKAYSTKLIAREDWGTVWLVFRSAWVFALIQILGILYNKTNIFFLEAVTGSEGVAVYSAAYNLVDPVSILASEQLLGWVIFPVLSALWWKNREKVGPLVRGTVRWLMVIAFPIMFFLFMESRLIIGLVFPAEYKDAAWMMQYLVWTILLSFWSNLFQYIMMVVGAVRLLLLFSVIGILLNLAFNVTMVQPLGLAGGCLVLVLSKLVITLLCLGYCQIRFRFFSLGDFLIPTALAVAALLVCLPAVRYLNVHVATAVTLAFYLLILWRPGLRLLGHFPGRASD